MYEINNDIAIKASGEKITLLNRRNGKVIEIGKKEYQVLVSLTSNSDFDDIKIEGWSQDSIRSLIELFLLHNILVEKNLVFSIPTNKPFDLSRIKLLEVAIPQHIKKNDRENHFKKWFYSICAAICGVGILSYCHLSQILAVDQVLALSIHDVLRIYIMLLVALAIHELSHFWVCRKICGMAGKIGIALFFLQPTIYCNISDILLEPRQNRNIAFVSGPLVQLSCSSISLIAGVLLKDRFETWLPSIYIFSVINAIWAIVNFFPFVKTDGYWILSNCLRIDNLYEKGYRFWLCKALRKPAHTTLFIAIYGFLSIVSRCVIWAFLIWHISKIICDSLVVSHTLVFFILFSLVMCIDIKVKLHKEG